MTDDSFGRTWRTWRTLLVAAAIGVISTAGIASPGAHGPDGEHLEAPGQAQASGTGVPRLEAQTELFELVATLAGGELSLLIDRFQTNEPVLNAQVEVESGGLKAKARFHADHGDYAVDDKALLTLLGKAGDHPLVITVIAAPEFDLLDGRLLVGDPASADVAGQLHSHGHDDSAAASDTALSTRTKWLMGGALVVLALLAAQGLRWRSRRLGAPDRSPT